MNKILVLGAGKSSAYFFKYFQEINWNERLTVADKNIAYAEKFLSGNPLVDVVQLDIDDIEKTEKLISSHDVVVSMLPAFLHVKIAKICLKCKKHLITASYVSDEMRSLHNDAMNEGLIFLNEIGLDPGIDHMTAMQVMDKIRSEGGKIREFETFTGGLLEPGSEKDNPWKYKFTWNPRNVVLAGAGGPVKFIQEGQYKYIPYHRLFRRTEIIQIPGLGKFEGYANRDSLRYRELYGLQDALTLYRGTLRRPGFCKGWHIFVQMGMTDDSYVMENSEELTFRQYTNSFLPYHPTDRVEIKLMHYLNIQQDDNDLMEKLEWLDMFNDEIKAGIQNATPAMYLQHILERKWTMTPEDRDMVVMWHKFVYYDADGKLHEKQSSMHCIGESDIYSAMAKTVSLPVAIAARFICEGNIQEKGVVVPMHSSIYQPVLEELTKFDIKIQEWDIR